MAPLPARLASARRMARRSPIRATAIEAELGTRYTVDTLNKLIRLHPNRRFSWLMGGDNLVQLPQCRDWREIARLKRMSRSGERRGGKEWVSTGRSRGWP